MYILCHMSHFCSDLTLRANHLNQVPPHVLCTFKKCRLHFVVWMNSIVRIRTAYKFSGQCDKCHIVNLTNHLTSNLVTPFDSCLSIMSVLCTLFDPHPVTKSSGSANIELSIRSLN